MPYLQELQADTDIFEKLKLINVQDKYTLTPINFEALEIEATVYLLLCTDEDVIKHLPFVCVNGEEEVKQKLLWYIDKMIKYESILYCIRAVDDKIPVGYILINSPLSTEGIGKWSLDFWVHKEYRNYGLARACLSEVLTYMQTVNIEEVYSAVNNNNPIAINVLDFFGFKLERAINDSRNLYTYRLVNYPKPQAHYLHLATNNHASVAAFFMVKSFGLSMPVLTYFSTLKPIDRCIILEMLLERGVRNINLYNKMVLAYVKIGKPDYAKEIIEFAKRKSENPININGLEQKLGIGLPSEKTDEQRIIMLKDYLSKTDNSLEIRFLNILMDFVKNQN